jgi:type I restriction enzyme S subunit
MNKETNKLIPEIRFPEFVNEGEWIEVTIESVGDVVTGGTPSKEEDEYWGGDFVWVTAQDFKEKYIYDSVLKLTKKGKGKSRVIPKNSVLVTCIASIGLNGINKVECATNQQINSIVCNSLNHYEFVYYAISKNITRLKNMAGQTAVPIISKSIFEKFTIQKPQKPNEQQKIASCLSSLDEVITAHSQKLNLLKEHKKGLMQNLFPQDGETVPKYRFKEFVGDGEWVEKKLGDICVVNPTSNQLPFEFVYIDLESVENGILKKENKITLEGAPSRAQRLLIKNDVIYQMVRPYQMNNYFFQVENEIKYVASTGYAQLRAFESSEFLFQLIHTRDFVGKVLTKCTGSNYPAINSSDLKLIELQIPKNPKEQQKIASCLSSLDALITAQGEKIEQLKLHKKGLMQGLFPRIERG